MGRLHPWIFHINGHRDNTSTLYALELQIEAIARLEYPESATLQSTDAAYLYSSVERRMAQNMGVNAKIKAK